MIKVAELFRRRHDMPLDEFRSYWLERHGPAVSRMPGLRRYVQSHPLLGGYSKANLPFDGVAELWFDNKEALRAMADSKAFLAAKHDEPNFIDNRSLIELVLDEHVIKAGTAPTAGVKSISFIQFQDDVAPLEAQRYWRDEHGPIAGSIPGIRRYVQSHVRAGAYAAGAKDRPFIDGLAITWFDSVADMRAAAKTEQYRRTRADEVNFLKAQRPMTVLTHEHVVIG